MYRLVRIDFMRMISCALIIMSLAWPCTQRVEMRMVWEVWEV